MTNPKNISLSVSDRVFGCHLLTLCEREGNTVPRFVQICLDAVDKRGMFTSSWWKLKHFLQGKQRHRKHTTHIVFSLLRPRWPQLLFFAPHFVPLLTFFNVTSVWQAFNIYFCFHYMKTKHTYIVFSLLTAHFLDNISDNINNTCFWYYNKITATLATNTLTKDPAVNSPSSPVTLCVVNRDPTLHISY